VDGALAAGGGAGTGTGAGPEHSSVSGDSPVGRLPESAAAASRTWRASTVDRRDSRTRRQASAASVLIRRGTPPDSAAISAQVLRGNIADPSPPVALTRWRT